MLRQVIIVQTPIGKQAQDRIDQGQLIPNHAMIALIYQRIQVPDCTAGFFARWPSSHVITGTDAKRTTY